MTKKGKAEAIWKKHFEVLWATSFKHCEGWTMEKTVFMEEVNARALAEAQKQIEAKYTVDKKILMQVKKNMLH